MGEQHLPCKTTMSHVQHRSAKTNKSKCKELQLYQLNGISKLAISELKNYHLNSCNWSAQLNWIKEVINKEEWTSIIRFSQLQNYTCTVPEDMYGDWSVKRICTCTLRFLPYLHHVGIDTNRDRSISNEPSCHFCNNNYKIYKKLRNSQNWTNTTWHKPINY